MHQPSAPAKNRTTTDFLSGGGEMGQRIREFDWSKTTIGAPDTWPQSLRTCLRIMLDSRQPIWIGWGREWIKFYNDAYLSIIGGKHPWALGRPASEVWKDIWHDIAPMLRQVEEGRGTYVESQLLIMQRNGYPEETYYTFSYTPIAGEDGQTAGMFCANTDDTERIIGERQLRTLTQLGKGLTDCRSNSQVIEKTLHTLGGNPHDFPFAIFHSLRQGKAVLESATELGAAHSLLAAELDLHSGEPLTEAMRTAIATRKIQVVDLPPTLSAALPRGAWTETSGRALVLPISTVGAKEAYGTLLVGLNPYRLVEDKYRSFFALVADQVATAFADVHVLEEERSRLEAMAEIDRAKTAFFTNISHEFRTPLTLMLGSLEELLNKPAADPSASREKLEATHRNSMRLLRLVNNLLDFSRIEAGRVIAAYRRTDLGALTRHLAANFRPAMEQAGLAYEVDCPNALPQAYVDREMWEKIVLNLLSNAFKYTLKGAIRVQLQATEDALRLDVRDTGVGIPAAELPNMFQRFHRIQSGAGRTIEGTGIGLSLVKELVELHGGTIAVASVEGEGSCFTITLPLGKDHLDPTRILPDGEPAEAETGDGSLFQEARSMLVLEEPAEQEPAAENRATVLVVDDNTDMRQYIRSLLQPDFRVLTARNGIEALEQIGLEKPDLVVSDIMMPGMDGTELLKRIKEAPETSTLPVILVSARAGEEARIEGFDTGADDYLTKPFSARELLARVRAQIAIARKRNTLLTRLYELFDDMPFAVMVLKGPAFTIEYANKYTLKVWQRERAAVLNKPLFEAVPASRADAEWIHQQVYETGEHYRAEEMPVRLAGESGETIHYFTSIADPLKNEEGHVIGQLVTGLDVTDQVLARRQIEENRRLLQLITDALPALISFVDREERYQFVNRRYEEWFGTSTDSMLGRKVKEVMGAAAYERVKAQVDLAMGGQAVSFLMEVPYPNAGNRHVQAEYIPQFDETGAVRGFYAMITDITDRRNSELILEKSQAKLQEANDQLSLILNNIPAAVYLFGPKGELLQLNNEAARTFGSYTAEALLRTGDLEHLSEIVDRLFERRDEQGKPVTAAETPTALAYREKKRQSGILVLQEKNTGTEQWLMVQATPMLNDAGEVRMMLVSSIDITTEKQAEKAIRESESKFRHLITANIVGVLFWDLERGIVDANDAFLNMLGYSREELGNGLHWDTITPEAWHEVDRQSVAEIRVTGRNHPFQKQYIHKDGRLVDVIIANTAFEGTSNQLGVTFVLDISDRTRAEAQLQESEERFRSIANDTPAFIFMGDEETNCTFLNRQWLEFVGQPFEVAKDKAWADITHPDDVPGMLEVYSQAVRTRQPYQFEIRQRGANNRYHYILWKGIPRINAKGDFLGMLGVGIDVSESRQAIDALRESENRFRLLAESLPQMVWVHNPDGTTEYSSTSWKRYSGKESVSEAWKWMVHPDDWEGVMGTWGNARQEGHPFRDEVRLRNTAGIYRWHYAAGEPVRDASGTIIKWVGSLTDIHDQKTMAENLEKLVAERTQELQRSNDDLQRFAHVASHDLKEPVRKLKTFVSRLQLEFAEALPPRAQAYLQKLDTSATRMFSMIEGILLYSSLAASDDVMEAVDLDEVLGQIREDLEVLIREKQVGLHYDRLPVLRGSPLLLHQLFYNLISNSIKFAHPERSPLIRITAEEKTGSGIMEITVADNGIGFPQEASERIFETFTRLFSKDQYEGTGLGLSLCRKIMERHGGTIEAFSEPGTGARFVLRFRTFPQAD